MIIGLDGRPLKYPQTGIGSYAKQLVWHLSTLLSKSQDSITLFSDFSHFSEFPKFPKFPDQRINQQPAKIKQIITASNWPFLNYKQIWSNWSLKRSFKKNPVDIYHSFTNIDLPLKVNIPLVITVHDLIPYLFPKSVSPFFHLSFSFFIKRISKISQHIISISETTKNDLINYLSIPEEQISVIPNGISPIFKTNQDMNQHHRIVSKYMTYDQSKKYFLIVGPLSPHKNIPFILEAFSKASLNQACLLFIGAHKPPTNIISLINNLNLRSKCIFLPFITEEDLPSFYSITKALLFPSIYEGFGFPPLEATACGCEVLALNIKTAEELYPSTVTLLENKIDDWIDSLRILYNQPTTISQAMIESSTEVRKRYNWEKTANLTLKVYRNLV